jgi:DNA-directed RNA polymerase subunit N (RpoN/RPB10)
MRKRGSNKVEVGSWTCPHCQHVHHADDLLRFDNDTLRCYACGKAFPDISGPPTGNAYIRRLEKIAEQWENAAADRESLIENLIGEERLCARTIVERYRATAKVYRELLKRLKK